MGRIERLGLWLLLPVVFALAWIANDQAGWVNPLFLPKFSAFAAALGDAVGSAGLWRDVLATAARAGSGLAISVAIGVPVGLLLGRLPVLYRLFEVPLDFLRSIPTSALFFLFILAFGLGEASKVAIVVYGCLLVMIVSAAYGGRETPDKRRRIEMLKSFGAKPHQILAMTVVQDSLPNVIAGVRICTSLALVVVVVAEMFLGADAGLGRRIYDQYLAYRVPEMYAAIAVLGLLGYGLNSLISLLEERFAFWGREATATGGGIG